MGISGIIGGKPDLYHYTNPDALVGILESRSLWATPTWGFRDKDKAEYVFGLGIIVSWLQEIVSRKRERAELPHSTIAMMDRCGVSPRRVLKETIAHLEYELTHPDNPRVQIYVACLSRNPPSFTDPATVRMLKEYGECVVHFNWMLPLIGYAWPKPFVMAMLSRVSYNVGEFRFYIPAMIDALIWSEPRRFQDEFLMPLPLGDRQTAIATTLAILLCNFAVNIKQAQFEYEHEWRLKTIATDHQAPILQRDQLHWLRGFFKLPEMAEFTDSTPRRYVQQLTFHDRMIIHPNYGILKQPPIPLDYAEVLHNLEVRIREIQMRQGGVLGEAANIRDELLRMERERIGGLSPDKPIV